MYGSSLDVSGNPNLQSICCDATEVVYVQNICNVNNYTATVASCAVLPETASTFRAVSMFPNPVVDVLHLESFTSIDRIEIFTGNGIMVMADNNFNNTVDLQQLTSGIYFLKIYRKGDVQQMKFVKS